MRKNKICEKDITNILLNIKDKNFVLVKPKQDNKFLHYKYDICVKNKTKKDEVIGLIEAKYRTDKDRPTTDSLIASIIKLLYEWRFRFNKNKKIKLILLVYIKEDEKNLEDVNEHFRNDLIGRLQKFLKKFPEKCIDCGFSINIINIKVKVNDTESKIKNEKNIKSNIKKNIKQLFNF